MKNFFVLLFTLYLTFSFGQPGILSSDLQWFIKDNKGKNAVLNPTTNYYPTTPSMGNKITISGVQHQGATPYKNDLFIIYSDGKHFNSREMAGFSLSETNGTNQYNLQLEDIPLYLYYTNLYEGEDDPPASVYINNITDTDLTCDQIQHTDQVEFIYANHDAKKGKDITIIVKNPEYKNEAQKLYRLNFNNGALIPSRIFNNSSNFIYPYNNDILNSDHIILNFEINDSYKYINFKVDSNINLRELVFSLIDQNNTIKDTHTELVLESHDPNYIEVLNIFERNPHEYWAHMHVQCYNDSRDAIVDNTKIALTMPGTVDASTLEMTDWSYSSTQGALTDITITNSRDRVNFNFSRVDDQLAMQGMTTTVDQNQIAWVEYIVKINSSNVEEVAHINLKPLTPMTFFDGTPYNITRFIDRCFGNLSDRNDLCERKIQGPYYMGQFTETLALGSSTPTLISLSVEESSQNCVESHCCKVKCHKGSHKHCCKDKFSKESCEYSGKNKCCKKKKRFWKNVIPWVIAGVMTVIAVAD